MAGAPLGNTNAKKPWSKETKERVWRQRQRLPPKPLKGHAPGSEGMQRMREGYDRTGRQKAGAPKGTNNGNQYSLTHGVIAFRNRVKRRKRRGRSLIDRRSTAGKNAMAVRDEILADLGGAEGLAATKLVLVEMTARDVYFLDEIDRRIFKAIYKVAAKEKQLEKLGKIKNPGFIGTLYGYRQSAAHNLARNLLALGLEKAPPKQKTLQEILDEPEESDGVDEP